MFQLNDHRRLFLASFLMLFAELTIIRWASAHIYSLYFFTNFVLIASFLGIGIGFLRANSSKDYFKFSPLWLSALVLFCYLASVSYQITVNPAGNINYFGDISKAHVYPIILTLPLVFFVVAATMASLADEVARKFAALPSLQAYRIEVLGTLAGIIAFTGLAFLSAPPVVWGVVIALVYAVLSWQVWLSRFTFMLIVQLSALALMLGVFYKESVAKNHVWSTYYKIETVEYLPQSYAVVVNGLIQQVIESVEQRLKIKPFYNKPYEHMTNKKPLDNVLVIGAGTGGDVAIALAKGAKHVDAVEIDAKLYGLGKKLNPNQPYSDPRVTVHINDGRAFLQQTKQKYDLIIYALTDSLTLVPGQSSLRLENYLYTFEGLTAAANHLKSSGVFTIYNYYGVPWFADRIANTLAMVYQRSPCLDSYSSIDYWATVFTVSPDVSALQCQQYWENTQQAYITPATDNHPFIYLQTNSLTWMYALALVMIGALSYFSMRTMDVKLNAVAKHGDLFLMGSAFLLLETKSIINYALLFGTTWMVNSLVFIGVLFSVYLAIEVTARCKRFNVVLLYGCLLVALIIAWAIPMSQLLAFSPIVRFLLATVITFSPIFLANLIFSSRFSEAASSVEAMGANLIGAVLGGLLEYISLIVGYEHFALIVLAIYSLAFIWMVLPTSVRPEEARSAVAKDY